MIETKKDNEVEAEVLVEEVRNFLCSYRLCADLLYLQRYERKRAKPFDEKFECDELLDGNEACWRARMFAVGSMVAKMKNGREKLMIFYHYIRGESIEHAASLLNVSRRTGYRLHSRGLSSAAVIYGRLKKNKMI